MHEPMATLTHQVAMHTEAYVEEGKQMTDRQVQAERRHVGIQGYGWLNVDVT